MKFRKKPVIIDAVQFHPDLPLPEGVKYYPEGNGGFFIKTLEGMMQVRPGDWVITGVAGEKYPCREDIFNATYEAVL